MTPFCCCSRVSGGSSSSGVTRFGLFPSPDISFPRSPGSFSRRMKSLETQTWALVLLDVLSSRPFLAAQSYVCPHRHGYTQAPHCACSHFGNQVPASGAGPSRRSGFFPACKSLCPPRDAWFPRHNPVQTSLPGLQCMYSLLILILITAESKLLTRGICL